MQARGRRNTGDKIKYETMGGYVMKKAFGLDLAGYSTGRSALAMATVSDDAPPTVTIMTDSVFARKVKGKNRLPNHCRSEVECMQNILSEGKLFIDVPIDLRDLQAPPNPQFVWQLTKRPVDEAFGGLCPLASWLGACVARMQNLRRRLRDGNNDPLGKRLFETYPAGSLNLGNQKYEGYKPGQAQWSRRNHWRPCRGGNDKDITLAGLLNNLTWTADTELDAFTDDEFDAALCALTGFGNQLCEQKLRDVMNRRLAAKDYGDAYSAPLVLQRYKRLQ